MGLFDLGSDLLDIADEATFGIARKVTPNVIKKPIDGEELTAGDVVEDAATAILVPVGIDSLLDS